MADATYRLGTASIEGVATVVLETPEGCAPLSAVVPAAGRHTLLEVIEAWDELGGLVDAAATSVNGALDPASLRWLPPVLPRKLLCIGANYGRHNAEMLGTIEHPHPYAFLKPPTTTLVGHGAEVPLPTHAVKVDYEVELAIVIGRRVRRARGEDARAGIFGYSVLNDLSVRDFIPAPTFLGLDWVMLKGFDGSAPMGPWITPARFVDDPMRLRIGLELNGERRQDSSTADMIFSVVDIVEHLSSVMTLEPGDVIATGTPEGVAFGRTPAAWLVAGDHLRSEIEGLGALDTTIVAQEGEVAA